MKFVSQLVSICFISVISLTLLSACFDSSKPDNTAPVISLVGDQSMFLEAGEAYIEPGATALDDIDGEVEVEIVGVVDVLKPTIYTIQYFAKDRAGNSSKTTRTVVVADTTPPVIRLLGEPNIDFDHGKSYVDRGAKADDIVDGNIEVSRVGAVDPQKLGRYVLTYTAKDRAENSASLERVVNVVDRVPPVIRVFGGTNLSLMVGQSYEDRGARATDAVDGDIIINTVSNVDMTAPGEYTIVYSASDASGNLATATRFVNVELNTVPPVIQLNGRADVSLFAGDGYEDAGASATDDIDGDLSVEVFGEVNADVHGEYILTYTATDSSGNQASVTREVTVNPDAFITRWNTRGRSDDSNTISFFVHEGDVNFTVDWGDGSTQQITNAGLVQHRYASSGSFTVQMYGELPGIYFQELAEGIHDQSETFASNPLADATKLRSVERWSRMPWQTMERMFYGSRFLSMWASDNPNLSQVTDMSYAFAESGLYFIQDKTDVLLEWDVSNVQKMDGMFMNNSRIVLDLSQWDVSAVTSVNYLFAGIDELAVDVEDWNVSQVKEMRGLFAGSRGFLNINLKDWNVGNVTDMSEMLFNTRGINPNVSEWDVSKVKTLRGSFKQARDFDRDLAAWNVSSVEDMAELFYQLENFNSDLSQWNVSQVKDMQGMFYEAREFNGDLSNWQVGNVEYMREMFYYSSFAGDVSAWDVSKVVDMSFMFALTPFNGDVSAWNVSSVVNMASMFFLSSFFNGDISAWQVSNVENMNSMFYGSDFNGDVSEWDVAKVRDMAYLFGSSPFNGDISQWDVSQVEDMTGIFTSADFSGNVADWNVSSVTRMGGAFANSSFDGDLSRWNVANVEDMSGMFFGASYQGDISQWETGKVTNMSEMFQWASVVPDISNWNVSQVTNMNNMFRYVEQFDVDISGWDISQVSDLDSMFEEVSIPTEIYNKMLINWSQLDLQSNLVLDAGNSYHTAAGAEAIELLWERFGWYVVDLGLLEETQAIQQR